MHKFKSPKAHFLLISLASVSLGCAGEPSAETSLFHPPVAWEVSATPVLKIGDDSSEMTTFDRITGLFLASDGRTYLLDRGSATVRVFGPDGSFLESWGGRGEGPGEFSAPKLLGMMRGDTMVIIDLLDQEITYVSSEGEPGRNFRLLTPENPTPRQALAVISDGQVVSHDVTLFPGPLEEGEVLSDTVQLVLISTEDGASIDLGPSSAPSWTWIDGEQVPMPFSPQFSVSTRGDSVFTLGPSGSNIRVYTARGGRFVWESPRVPERVGPLDRDQYAKEVEDRGLGKRAGAWLKALDHPARPVVKPVYDRLIATDFGEVWARHNAGPSEEDEWDVFSPRGVVTGLVHIPSGLSVRQVTRDRLVGVMRDSLGVQTVAVYEIRKIVDSEMMAVAYAEIREELEGLVELQEIYFADHMAFASRLSALLRTPPVRHSDVRIQLLSGGPKGWAASATHLAIGPDQGCSLFRGEPAIRPDGPFAPEVSGVIACTVALEQDSDAPGIDGPLIP